MESGLCIWKRKNKFLLLIFLILLGCNQEKKPISLDFDTKDIKSGDFICRQGDGFFSDYFRKYASKEQIYSHIGILSVENDSLFVYHSEASELTGIGFVKRDFIDYFLDGIKVYKVFSPYFPDSIKMQIAENAKIFYTKRTPFDMNFDSQTDNELYCTEMVAKAINQSVGEELIKPTLILDKNHLYSIDDCLSIVNP